MDGPDTPSGNTQYPDRGIVLPVKGKSSPQLPPVAVMVSSQTDLDALCRKFDPETLLQRTLYNGKLFWGSEQECRFCFAGPLLGAPYAVMVLETLVAWGAREILFFGWCGSISDRLQIGDILLPTGAFVDEGTSLHYGAKTGQLVSPSKPLLQRFQEILRPDSKWLEGPIWTTDAIYRETPAKVSRFMNKGALAVEMEVSALFTTGRFLNVEVGAVLVVSDELSSLKWRPGFTTESFREGRSRIQKSLGIYLSNE